MLMVSNKTIKTLKGTKTAQGSEIMKKWWIPPNLDNNSRQQLDFIIIPEYQQLWRFPSLHLRFAQQFPFRFEIIKLKLMERELKML